MLAFDNHQLKKKYFRILNFITIQKFEIEDEAWNLIKAQLDIPALLQEIVSYVGSRAYDPIGGIILEQCLNICTDPVYYDLFNKHRIEVMETSRDVSYRSWDVIKKAQKTNLGRLYNFLYPRVLRTGGSGGLNRPDNIFEICLTKKSNKFLYYIILETDKDSKDFTSGNLNQVCRKLFQSVDFCRANDKQKNNIAANVRINLHHFPKSKAADETEAFKNFFHDLVLSVLRMAFEILQHFVYDIENPHAEKYDLMFMVNDFSSFPDTQYATLGVRCGDQGAILRDPPAIIYMDTQTRTRKQEGNGDDNDEEDADSSDGEDDEIDDEEEGDKKKKAGEKSTEVLNIRKGRLSVSKTNSTKVFAKDVLPKTRSKVSKNKNEILSKKVSFATQVQNTFPAQSWFGNEIDKVNWYRERMCRYLHCFQPTSLGKLKRSSDSDDAIYCSVKRSNAALESLRSDLWDNWQAKVESQVTILPNSHCKLRVNKIGFQRINVEKILAGNRTDPKKYQGFAYTRDIFILDKSEPQFQYNSELTLQQIDLEHKSTSKPKANLVYTMQNLLETRDPDAEDWRLKNSNSTEAGVPVPDSEAGVPEPDWVSTQIFPTLWGKQVRCIIPLPAKLQDSCVVCYFMAEPNPMQHDPEHCPYHAWIEKNTTNGYFANLLRTNGVHVFDDPSSALHILAGTYHQTGIAGSDLVPEIQDPIVSQSKAHEQQISNPARNAEIDQLLFYNAQTEMTMALFRCFYAVNMKKEAVRSSLDLNFEKPIPKQKNMGTVNWQFKATSTSTKDSTHVASWAFENIDDLDALYNFSSFKQKTPSPSVSAYIEEVQEEFREILLANPVNVQGMIEKETSRGYSCRTVPCKGGLLFFTGIDKFCVWQFDEVLRWTSDSRQSVPAIRLMDEMKKEFRLNPWRFFKRENMAAFTKQSVSLQSKLMDSLNQTLPELNYSVLKLVEPYKNESMRLFLRMIRVSDYETLRALAMNSAFKDLQQEHDRILGTMPIATQYAIKNMYARIRTERVRIETFSKSAGLNTIRKMKK